MCIQPCPQFNQKGNIMANTKKARTITVSYMDANGNYLSDVKGEYIKFAVKDYGSFNLYPDLLTPELQKRAMFHGFNQKVRDAAAGADHADQLAAMKAVFDNMLDTGAWDKARDGLQISDERIITAMLRMRPTLTAEKAKAAIDKANVEAKRKLIVDPKFAAILAKIREEELAAKAAESKDDILDSMFGEEEEEEAENDEADDEEEAETVEEAPIAAPKKGKK